MNVKLVLLAGARLTSRDLLESLGKTSQASRAVTAVTYREQDDDIDRFTHLISPVPVVQGQLPFLPPFQEMHDKTMTTIDDPAATLTTDFLRISRCNACDAGNGESSRDDPARTRPNLVPEIRPGDRDLARRANGQRTDRQTDRQTDRRTDGRTDEQAGG